MTPFRSWRLSYKLASLIALGSVLPLVIFGVVTFSTARRLLSDDASQLLTARADQLTSELDGFHYGYINNAQQISFLPAITRYMNSAGALQEDERQRIESVFRAHLRIDPNVRAVNLIDTNANVLVSSDRSANGRNLNFRRYAREVLRGRQTVSDLFVATSPPEEPLIAYAAPVRDASDVVVGAVCFYVKARAFWDAARATNGRAGEGSYTVVLDQHGIRIAHSFRADEVFYPAGALDPRVVDEMVQEQRFGTRTRELLTHPRFMPDEFERARRIASTQRNETIRYRATANERWNYAVARRLKYAQWTVFAVIPVESVQGPANSMLGVSLATSAIVLLLALIVGGIISRSTLTPLGDLLKATRKIAAGDLATRVPVHTRDELGQLGTRFNEMAGALAEERANIEQRVRDRTVELERANEELQAQREELLAQREELRVQQKELQAKNIEIERGNRLKSEFLANMSHELRTPLNSIIGFSELVLEETRGTLSLAHQTHLEDVLASGRHLLNLINDILDLSKIEAGAARLELVEIDPATAVKEASALVAPAARRRDMRVIEKVVTTRKVRADEGKLRQILLNLLSNAIKFGPQTSVVTIGVEDAGELTRWYVEDEGQGIDPSLEGKLFQPFVQGENHLVKHHQGTGLGLAICKRLVEMHGGTIAHEKSARGARFVFTLPAAGLRERNSAGAAALTGPLAKQGMVFVVENDSSSAAELREVLEGANYNPVFVDNHEEAMALASELELAVIMIGATSDAVRKQDLLRALEKSDASRGIPVIITTMPGGKDAPSILAIDDDPRVGTLLKSMLEPAGYRVTVAHRGAEAIELASKESFDLFIVDLMMPEMSGVEVIDALAKGATTQGRPVILLTAADVSDTDRNRIKHHVKAIAEKGGITRDDILAAIRRATERTRKQPSVQEGAATVLVVDDHDLNRNLARSLLERMGYRVLLAEDGDAGVRLAISEQPAIILMDLAMPKKDGYSATRELRANAKTAHIPVLALTALAMRGDEEKAYEAGFDGYLTKPIDRHVLAETVARFVRKSKET